jgi:hypothetical protein
MLNQPLPPDNLRLGMDWLPPKHSLTHLGVTVGTDTLEHLTKAWTKAIDASEFILLTWSRRNLSIFGCLFIVCSLYFQGLLQPSVFYCLEIHLEGKEG